MIETVEFADGTKYELSEIANLANQLDGTEEDDTISGFGSAVGYNYSETIHGLGGNDTISGNDGADTIYGDEGNDTIYGGNGNDTLIGGEGSDRLEGGYHNDTYVFNLGDGEDTIYDFHDSYTDSRADRILFGKGISLNDVSLERVDNNLVVSYSVNDKVTIQDAYRYYYGAGKFEIENIDFEDGTQTRIDYNTVSLEVTYMPEIVDEIEEEIVIDENVTEIVIDESNLVVSDSSEVYESVTNMADAITEVLSVDDSITNYDIVIYLDIEESDTNASIETDVNKMTDLLIQELSGDTVSGVSEINTFDTNETVSDDLLWTE